MKEKPENFTEGIHNDDYENEYLQIRLNASRLVNITGRETESLNGKWNFGVDLYDTCRLSAFRKFISKTGLCGLRFNRKGLIDADRKTRKPAFYVMREFYSWIKNN